MRRAGHHIKSKLSALPLNLTDTRQAKVSQALPGSLTESIRLQRQMLQALLIEPMKALSSVCADVLMQPEILESLLVKSLLEFNYCKQLFVLDSNFIQITQNIARSGADSKQLGRDRSGRPYVVNIVGKSDFKLSEAYVSRNQHRPSLTAIQVIRNQQGDLLGFLGADFDMRELPHTGHCYKEPDNWFQMKGDPSIRRGLFYQQRVNSIMDQNIDEAMDTMQELMAEYGVFHCEFHFSKSRATVWHKDDPFVYHQLTINELTTLNIFLAFPRRTYIDRAILPAGKIKDVFEMFKKLRFADENIYLRTASLNLVNGLVGLNFSCDGTHSMRYNEFLDKNIDFWFGKLGPV